MQKLIVRRSASSNLGAVHEPPDLSGRSSTEYPYNPFWFRLFHTPGVRPLMLRALLRQGFRRAPTGASEPRTRSK